MDGTYILVTAFLVGLSGAMAPGPLTAVTIEHSLKKGFLAGPLVAFGHSIMEAVFVILLAAGLGTYMAGDHVGGVIGLVGGVVLFWMGYNMIKGIRAGEVSMESESQGGLYDSGGFYGGSVAAGTLATVSNPYWFIWWATVGAGYITISMQYGTTGLLLFFTGHIAADLGWLCFLSFILASGKRFISERIYRGIMASLSVFILGMGGYFVWSGIDMLELLA